MPRRNSLWNRKDGNQPLPSPKTPIDQKARCNKGPSIDDFISNPSPQWTNNEHRWSFSSNMSSQNSVYYDFEKNAGTSTKQGPKKRGKRPTPLLPKTELEAIETSSSSEEEPEMPQPEPMPHEQKSKKTKSKTKRKKKSDDDATQVKNASGEESKQAKGESTFGWSRLPSTKLSQKKGEWKKKMSSSLNSYEPISQGNGDREPLKKTRSLETPFSRKPLRRAKSARGVVESTDLSPSKLSASQKPVSDPISQSMRNAPLSSNGDRKPLKKTRSLKTTFSRGPMRKAKSARSVESTDPFPSDLSASQKPVSDPISQSMRNAPLSSNGDRKPLKKTRSLETVSFSRQPPKRSKSNRILDNTKRDASLDPSDLRKPPRKTKSSRNVNNNSDSLGDSVDTLMHRSDNELSRIRSKLEKIKSSRKLDEPNRSRKEVRSLDRMTMKKSKSSRKMIADDSSDDEGPTEETKESSRKFDESNRSRKEVRSLDRMALKKSNSSRKMIAGNSSDDEGLTEEIKEKLGGSLPDVPFDSSFRKKQKKSKPKSAVGKDLDGNRSGTDLSLDVLPGRKKEKRPTRSESEDSWVEDSESDLAHMLSSSSERFHKAKPPESDACEHADAMQMWSARLKTKPVTKSSPDAKVSTQSPERRNPPRTTKSGRRSGVMKGKSLPNLFLDAPINQRKKANRPKSRTSISVCSNQNERDLSLESFGGRIRKRKPRPVRSLDDDSGMYSSESDVFLKISKGLGGIDRTDELKESSADNQEGVDISQRSASNQNVVSSRNTSDDRLKMLKANFSRNVDQSSDHCQKDEEEPRIRKEPQKTPSDRSLAKTIMGGDMERKTPSRTTSARQLGASSNHPPVRIDFEGKMNESKNISEVLDNISEVLAETERLKRIMHLETVLHTLQETFQELDAKVADMDLDNPMRIETRKKVLEAENEVLLVRLDQQDEALKKYKNQSNVQNVAIEGESDQSATALKQELEEMKAKLEEKDKIIEEQALRCNKTEAEMEELKNEVLDGKEVQTLQKRIWELEKEKTAFMTEISRLHKTNFDTSQTTVLSPQSTTSVSTDQSDDDNNNQGPGLVGWWFRAPPRAA
eukprot:CAMPEP_0113614322 /NCGR_PEP_ID=MMETSP0017_2-20120614/7103_1 /TAXON_ID=2856 /ORGANISM="Cylindrotheca closterium" /LENGTH=1087 /DNA_ID=CAMNT_0000523479 /DNA_START=43 /DNA_END=3306 /DNA_ORIENTATION=- /assembly_acc=CAM_ASM_000147